MLSHSVENIASIISTAITPASEHVPLAAYLNLEARRLIIQIVLEEMFAQPPLYI